MEENCLLVLNSSLAALMSLNESKAISLSSMRNFVAPKTFFEKLGGEF